MKKLIAAVVTAGLLTVSVNGLAMPTEFAGGVNNEYEYEEIAFLSGIPVKFTGSCKISETHGKDRKTVSYTFRLNSADPKNPGKLDRQMTYETSLAKNSDRGQTIATTANTKMKETVTIGADKYELKDYQFSKSDFIDNRPASDFYSGNIKARKYYTVNATQGKAIVDISGGEVGYNNFWGDTGTQVLDQVISVEKQVGAGTDASVVTWQGTVSIQSSDSTTKSVKYTQNEANYASFEGGNMKLTNREMVSKIQYELPKFGEDGKPLDTGRNNGTVELNKKMDTEIERLLIPKLKDIGGHWAEEDINRLYSVGIYDDMLQFFTPDIPMTRKEYVKAVMKVCNINIQPDSKSKTAAAKSKTPEVSPFEDVSTSYKEYPYIKEAVSRGIIRGVSDKQFMPEMPLTRAESIVVMMRALGFDNKAPAPGYSTSFDDDRDIPEWSKDSIYIAKEVGMVTGDENNRFNPNKVMTRAEASAMLSRFLKFLEKDLQKDYRDNIILFK